MPNVHTAPDGECTYYEENDLPSGGETTVFCDRDAGHEHLGQRHAYSMSSGEIEFGPALGDLLAEHGVDPPKLTPPVLDEIAADLDAVAAALDADAERPPLGIMPPLPQGMVMTEHGPAHIALTASAVGVPTNTPDGVEPAMLFSFSGPIGATQILLVFDKNLLRQFVQAIREQAGYVIAETDKMRGPKLAVPPTGLIVPGQS